MKALFVETPGVSFEVYVRLLRQSGVQADAAVTTHGARRLLAGGDYRALVVDLRSGDAPWQMLESALTERPSMRIVALAESPVPVALRRRAYASGVWELVEGPPLRVSSYAPSLVPAVRRAVDDTDASPLLYVDGCREMTARMSALLVEEGYRVETAPGAPEAIRMMAQRPYALIVTESASGVPRGGDVLRAAARLQPGIPVIVLTASLEDAEFLKAVELGARGCLSKLAGPDRIVDEIRGAIVAGRAHGQSRRQGG